MRNKSGVTLIELVVCIAIIGILASICIPAAGYSNRFLLERCSKELLYDMRLVQQKAVAEGYTCIILFNASDNRYKACRGSNGNILFEKKLPDGIVFDSSKLSAINYKLTFTDSGNATSGTVSLIDKKSGQRQNISIQIATGYIGFSDEGT